MSNNPTIKTNTNANAIQHRAVKDLKTTKSGGKRFWEESADFSRLFKPGDAVNYFYDKAKQVFIVEKAEIIGSHTISSRSNGKPILDVKNKSLSELFEGVEKIEILYFPNKLIVKVANVEQAQNERSNKKSFRTYELFAGSGTLSQMFKQANYHPVGGIEREEKYLKMFEKNHGGNDTYTICSSIEDILPEAYPKDIDVALVGIPCTNYTKANKQLAEAKTRQKKGISTKEDQLILEKEYEAEALSYYVLEAVRAMRVRTIVIEEVVEFSSSPASYMIRTVLSQMGYKINETICTGTNSKRRRWCLIADANFKIPLDNLLPKEKKTIEELLLTPVESRDWKPIEEHKRIKRASTSVGIRSVLPSDTMTNTFTTHWTRSCEPILRNPTDPNLFDEFTNEEIKKIHGLSNDFILSEKKTIARQCLGQGVTNQFYYLAKRIRDAYVA